MRNGNFSLHVTFTGPQDKHQMHSVNVNLCAIKKSRTTVRRRKAEMKKIHGIKRLDSSCDRLTQTLFSTNTTAPLTDLEVQLLTAAESGDLPAVKRSIIDYNVNINCVDYLGRSALELSVAGEHNDVIEYLLPRSNLQCVEDALLHAISRDNVKLCEVILEHPLYKSNRVKLGSTDGFYQNITDCPRLTHNISPIVLAAKRNNFYIVQLLLLRGALISTPHDYFCDCVECSNQKKFDSVKYSRSRLETYYALTSPAYISLSADDPILTAFQLSHELESLSEIEKEYKSDYKSLSTRCKDYAVDLLDLCRSSEEITAILNEDEEDDDEDDCVDNLARVKLAIKYEQKRFIANATCQRQLISMWYSGFAWMRHQHVMIKLLAVPVTILLLPVLSLIFLLAPGTTIAKKMRSPFVKFLNHTCSYIVFLILVFTSTTRTGSANAWMDIACLGYVTSDAVILILILIWILGMLVHECRQLWREGPLFYFSDWWNWMDSSLVALYLASYSLQLVSFGVVSSLPQNHPVRAELCPNITTYECRELDCEVTRAYRWYTECAAGDCRKINDLYTPKFQGEAMAQLSIQNQVADIFFAIANVFSFARIIHLLPANEQLGPLLVSFGRMLHDVVRFLVVFALVLLAFMCGLTSLYRVHQCENKYFSSLDKTMMNLFWATFGMGDTTAPRLDERYLGINSTMIKTHSQHTPWTQVIGYVLFCVYIAGAVVVLLNMLIAMMSNSFQEIYDDRDVEWKFARAKLWSDFFEGGCTLPSPFNLIPNPKYLIKFFMWIKRRITETKPEPPVQLAYIYARRKNGISNGDIANIELPQKPESLYKQITRRLVQRYIYKKQLEAVTELQETDENTEMRQDLSNISSTIERLRLEVGYLRHACAQTMRTQNGFHHQKSIITRTEARV